MFSYDILLRLAVLSLHPTQLKARRGEKKEQVYLKAIPVPDNLIIFCLTAPLKLLDLVRFKFMRGYEHSSRVSGVILAPDATKSDVIVLALLKELLGENVLLSEFKNMFNSFLLSNEVLLQVTRMIQFIVGWNILMAGVAYSIGNESLAFFNTLVPMTPSL
ncbi:hypothetical protein BD770DRAFT_412699 [Pilaira anomala]|nr:hypothetical protein BD770DRAFT_412699 [Pilaira anomala]